MTRGFTITKQIHFRQGDGQRKVMNEGQEPEKVQVGNIPRVSRLMALAIRMEKLVADGEVADYADLARLAHVTRARITQIMNLLHLAPDIQEAILFLPPGEGGRDPFGERMLRPIMGIIDWRKQRKAWKRALEPQRCN